MEPTPITIRYKRVPRISFWSEKISILNSREANKRTQWLLSGDETHDAGSEPLPLKARSNKHCRLWVENWLC